MNGVSLTSVTLIVSNLSYVNQVNQSSHVGLVQPSIYDKSRVHSMHRFDYRAQPAMGDEHTTRKPIVPKRL